MSDTDDHPFVKPSYERKKEKKKKKKKASDESGGEIDSAAATQMELASNSDASLSSMARRKRIRAPTDDDASSDSCTETDASAPPRPAKVAAAKKCRSKEPAVQVSTESASKVKVERSAPAPAIRNGAGAPLEKPSPVNPAVNRFTCEQYARKASSLVDEVLKYCLDERNKIGKVQAAFIMERVSDLNRVSTCLAIRNNFLSGSLDALQATRSSSSPADRAPRPTTVPTLPTTSTPSYASMAGRNTPAQRRSVAGATQPHPTGQTPGQNVAPTLRPLLAPNGVLPPKSRAITEQVIAAARSAPAKHQVVILPQEPTDGDSAVTKQKLFNSIDLKKARIGIKSIRSIKDGGIIIETPNAKDLKVFTENSVLRNAGLKVAPPKSDLPRIVVRDIPKELEATDIAEHIRAQNLQSSPTLDKAILRPLFKVGRKDKEGNDWVLEVSNPIRESLLPREKIFVSYMHCRVSDYLVATRCFKCQKYGHVDKYCKSTETVCAFCSKTGHSNKECPNREKNPSCANCRARQLPHNHSAGNRNCPSRSSALLQKASRIDYS